jgi:MFS family permease
MSLRAYLVLLRPPGARRLLAAALMGRLPIGIFSLAIVLVVRHQTGSFGDAGGASAAFALGAGVIAPLQGRLIDRFGQPAVLIPSAVVNAAALGELVLAAHRHAPDGLLILLAGIAGAALPPLSACMRSQWATLFADDDGARGTAYSLESVFNEVVFVAGPALTALLVALWSSTAALLIAAGLSLVGTLAFAATGLARGWRGDVVPRTAAGALVAPGMRTLVFAVVPTGIAFGALEIAMPAFAVAHGHRGSLAGVLLSAMAVGSVAGGLWSGGRRWSQRVVVRFLSMQAAFVIGLLPLLLASSVFTMGLAMLLAGLALAPSAAAGYLLIDQMAPAGTATEAYTWVVTANVTGTAIGAALAGVIVQHTSVRWALVLACAGPALGMVIALTRRRSLDHVTASVRSGAPA